ncbi:MAG: 3-deoxy-7-phosphoheptulonate synthase [Gemmataceae bacterium]|nr:3-deoxy-7-phosphoheptulonate synthase [Gemmataceae bacterium]
MNAVIAEPPENVPYRLAALGARTRPTVVRAGGLVIGEGVAMIAGPCSVESREQLLRLAQVVKESGATGLRGGAFKPRTSPYSFQGLKEAGLELLALAREETGLAVVTEAMAPEQVPLVARYADMVQIGARNMQNYPLLVAAGEAGLPVLLKRGPSATMTEFLLAAEYVLSTGNPNVVLCERGVRTFEDHVRFTLPLAGVPWLKARTHLPVIVDPSHGTGDAALVGPMARAAVAVGADGLLVEIHHDPARALSDGDQALTPPMYARMMAECRSVAQALGRSMG